MSAIHEGDNLASVLVGVTALQMEQREEPQPGETDVVVSILSVGVCGSDVHYFEHGRIGDYIVDGPLILGHEASGVIVGIGPGVRDRELGQRVAIEPGVPDGTCRQCREGRYNLCAAVRFLATPPIDGAFVRRLVVPAGFTHLVPDTLSDDAAALIEPLSVAVSACRRGEVGLGSSVLITGAGPIGILVALVAAHGGASRVVLSDVSAARLKRAAELTNATVVHADSISGLDPFDSFIECSGSPQAATAGFAALAPAGVAVMVGMGAETTSIPTALLMGRELRVTGAFRYANVYPTAIRLAASGDIALDSLVDRHYSLVDAESALRVAREDPSVLKAVVRVQE
jgi:L-iditol 2-dehydrogenase